MFSVQADFNHKRVISRSLRVKITLFTQLFTYVELFYQPSIYTVCGSIKVLRVQRNFQYSTTRLHEIVIFVRSLYRRHFYPFIFKIRCSTNSLNAALNEPCQHNKRFILGKRFQNGLCSQALFPLEQKEAERRICFVNRRLKSRN